jgi:hypothetical protein
VNGRPVGLASAEQAGVYRAGAGTH